MNRTHGNRGSTLLLVLAMLSILFLIGAALSFSTRMESQASANFGDLTQARTAAATGLPTAAPLIAAAARGLTSTLQPWYLAPAEWNKAGKTSSPSISSSSSSGRGSSAKSASSSNSTAAADQPVSTGEQKSNPQAIFSISDLSGRVNINAVHGEEPLARVIDGVLPGSATDAHTKARELIRLRGGDQVSTSSDRLDLRRASASPQQQRLSSLGAVRTRKGKQTAPIFTEEELKTLQNYLTVFSQSPEVFNRDDGTSIPKLPLHDINAQSVYDLLKQSFPTAEDALLRQFAVNVVDYSDPDDTPTLLDAAAQATQPWKVTFGSEQTPLITEVYPDATTPVTDGDHGQFVEISNPWNKPMVMLNYRLAVAGAGNIILNQTLPPNGTLVITDNYDQPAQDSTPGTGSFLSIFGARKDDTLRKVQVEAGLKLPDRDSYVSLYDAGGHLIDAFAYGSPGQMDTKVSFQREDPRLRVAKTADATPFEQTAAGVASKMQSVRDAWNKGNQPLHSVTDLFQVSTAYVGNVAAANTGNLGAQVSGSAHPWQLPTLTTSSTSPSTTNLDLRIVDMFTNWERESRSTSATIANARDNKSGANRAARQSGFQQRSKAGTQTTDANHAPRADDASTSSAVAFAYGKLNLNTCAKVALQGLEVKVGGTPWPTGDTLEKFETYRLHRLQENKTPFVNVSDFLVEFFPKLSREDLPQLANLLDQVTVGSSAFEITSQNRLSPDDTNASKENSGRTRERLTRRPAIAKVRWVLSMDDQPFSLVQMTTVP